MTKDDLKEKLQNLLEEMMQCFETCEPEYKCDYLNSILVLIDRIYALDKKIFE